VKKSTSQVTKTVDFHFLTDERIKQHPKNQEEYKEVNFMSELRKHSSTPVSERSFLLLIQSVAAVTFWSLFIMGYEFL
jgi:hypothetical protein